jgi:hypothetical protein
MRDYECAIGDYDQALRFDPSVAVARSSSL